MWSNRKKQKKKHFSRITYCTNASFSWRKLPAFCFIRRRHLWTHNPSLQLLLNEKVCIWSLKKWLRSFFIHCKNTSREIIVHADIMGYFPSRRSQNSLCCLDYVNCLRHKRVNNSLNTSAFLFFNFFMAYFLLYHYIPISDRSDDTWDTRRIIMDFYAVFNGLIWPISM